MTLNGQQAEFTSAKSSSSVASAAAVTSEMSSAAMAAAAADEGDLSEAVLRAKAFSAYESGNYAELYRIIQVGKKANQLVTNLLLMNCSSIYFSSCMYTQFS